MFAFLARGVSCEFTHCIALIRHLRFFEFMFNTRGFTWHDWITVTVLSVPIVLRRHVLDVLLVLAP